MARRAAEARDLRRRLALGSELQRFRGRHWPAEDEALDLRAAEPPDQGQLLERLRAFRGRVHAEALGKHDDGADYRGVAAAGRRRAADEALVDLDLVERRVAQMAEARAAGAEIVERDPDADRPQPSEHLLGRSAIGEEHLLADLELEPLGLDSGDRKSTRLNSSHLV